MEKERINEILDKMTIEVVAEKLGIATHKKGNNMVVDKCPFCGASHVAYISPSHGVFKCFTCGTSCSSVKLVMQVRKVDFEGAMLILEGWYNETRG